MKFAIEWIVGIAFCFFVFGNIFVKAGYSRWNALLTLVPIFNIFVLLWFATADWPVEKQLSKVRAPSAR